MRTILLFAGLILAIALVLGCTGSEQKVVCNAPYILVGTDCCLDNNDNSICDKDEQQIPVATQPTPEENITEVETKQCNTTEFKYEVEEQNCDRWDINFPAFLSYKVYNWEFEEGDFQVWIGFIAGGQPIGEWHKVKIPARSSITLTKSYDYTISGCDYTVIPPTKEVCSS